MEGNSAGYVNRIDVATRLVITKIHAMLLHILAGWVLRGDNMIDLSIIMIDHRCHWEPKELGRSQ